MKTFREFQDTRVGVTDLSVHTQDDDLAGTPGLTYELGGFISEQLNEDVVGRYHLIIGNLEWLSDSLEELELRLYAYWYVEEAR